MITCHFERGNGVALRHVTVDTVVMSGHRVLLGKRGTFQGKPILETGKWALLGGFMDRDENLIETAKREVREEAGIEIDKLILVRIIDKPDRPKEDRQNVSFVFLAQATSQDLKKSEETNDLKWYDIDNVPHESDWAFDHYESFMICKKYLQKTFSVPVIG